MKGRVLIVAGSDSGGGAGVQADIKTVTALGGYALTAITALTAQDTNGVQAIQPVPPDFVALQMRMGLQDIGADCIKLGMLHRTEVVQAVADTLEQYAKGIPVVVDPVMLAKGGQALLTEDAVRILVERIIPRATLLTPNAPEAEALTGLPVVDRGTMNLAAAKLARMGAEAVLVKGGHIEGPTVVDFLFAPAGGQAFESPRIDTPHTHGTGCTLASAVATGLAQGLDLIESVARARDYVQEAIRRAPGFGRGQGPLDHTHPVRRA
jgi:hydroxymethylpyrimidine/phosphomethylpyrimidine kinase